MSKEPFLIQLSWNDPETGDRHDPILPLPVALGRDRAEMPETVHDCTVTPVVLNHQKVSRCHALITLERNQVLLTDQSINGTLLHNHRIHQGSLPLQIEEQIIIGPYQINITLVSRYDPEATQREETRRSPKEIPLVQTIWWHEPWAIAIFGTVLAVFIAVGTWALVSWALEKSRPSLPSDENQSIVIPRKTR